MDIALRRKTLETPAEEDERLFFYTQPRSVHNLVDEILEGLQQTPKKISPKFFYDSKGAQLFDEITQLPEYYLTRVEREIFTSCRHELATLLPAETVIIEPGSGSSEKIQLLLNAIKPRAYVPLEITESHLHRAALTLTNNYPWLTVHAVCADYSHGIHLPEGLPTGPRLLFFPGSTIGNFEPAYAQQFLKHLHEACGHQGYLLIGVDLVKEHNTLNAAYNDALGITSAFNLNVLDHLNYVADADFDTRNFQHVAFFNERESRIEMHLQSLSAHRVSLADQQLAFDSGERIHTENSYKYSLESFQSMVETVGFKTRKTWCDEDNLFSIHLLQVKE